jgi:hypothetical protein
LNSVKSNKNKIINISTIFLSPTLANDILEFPGNKNIRFSALFYSEKLVRFSKYIIAGGYLKSEGDYSSIQVLFNRENLIDFFKKISKNHIERLDN